MFLKINGKRHYLWRAVDQAGNVLDILVQSRRNQAAAKKVFRKLLPWRWSWLVPLLKVVFPLQLLAALLAPQRIRWRGHLMEAQPGGSVRIVERRAAGR